MPKRLRLNYRTSNSSLVKIKIGKVGDPNKIREMLNKIEYPNDYNNSITKLLPYIFGKKKTIANVQISESISIVINIDKWKREWKWSKYWPTKQ